MPEERSDKLIREKIEGLDTLPAGFRLQSNEDWLAIEQKLRPASRKGFGWWYAAAAVLLIVASTFLWNNTTLQPPVLQRVTVKQSKVPAKQVVPATNSEKTAAGGTSLKIVLKNTGGPAATNELPVIDTPSHNMAAIEESVTTAPALNNTPSIITVTSQAPIKKRLKIIHVNELGNEPEIIYTRGPLKKNQLAEDNNDDLQPLQGPRSWWQTKPKTVTTVTLSDNN